MRKISFIIPVLIFFCSCSSMWVIDESGNEFDKEYIKKTTKTLGTYFYAMDERVFKFSINEQKEIIKNDKALTETKKQKMLKFLDGLKFSEKQYFYYSLTFEKPHPMITKGNSFVLTDARGKNLIEFTMQTRMKRVQIMRQHTQQIFHTLAWFIKTTKPINKENFLNSEIPLTFTAVLMKRQKKWYKITPE